MVYKSQGQPPWDGAKTPRKYFGISTANLNWLARWILQYGPPLLKTS